MSQRDMRHWIRTLEQAGELLHVKKPVDPSFDMGALLYQSREKALLFENVAGFPGWQVLGQAPANLRQAALAMGVPQSELVPEFSRRSRALPPCKLVDDGPVREVLLEGDQVDVTKLPAHICGQRDGGRFISSGLVISKDPETGIRNMSFHRMQIKGPRKVGILLVPRHTALIYRRYELKDEPMPISIMIGHHPLYYFAASYTGPFELDELELAGGLLGEPVELVRCRHANLEVPAFAEIALEGYILPKIREEEGPFSEFQDYYVAGMGINPVVQIERITMRRDARYFAVQNGSEVGGCVFHKVPMGVGIYDRLKSVGGFTDVKTVVIQPGIFGVVIQFNQRFKGEAKNVLMAALATQYLHPKVAVAVDEDVDPFNPADVLWAINTRVNPAEDVFIIPGVRIHPMDPTASEVLPPGTPGWSRYGSKIGIDATKPPLYAPEEERAVFERVKPIGWGSIWLKDYL